jgi:hypothetical protein
MSQFFQSRPVKRAPRVNLRGAISITVQLENGRQLSARLHQLSITGGLLELADCVEERVWVGLKIHLGSSVVRPTAEMMFPMRSGIGYLQPFRITRIRPDELARLDKEITQLRRHALAPATPGHGQGFRPPHYYLEST